MKRAQHVPMRSCLGCGEIDAQGALIRIVRDPAGILVIDAQRRAGGRGGYLHPRPDCWARFRQRKGPVRSLRAAVDRPARMALVELLSAGARSEG